MATGDQGPGDPLTPLRPPGEVRITPPEGPERSSTGLEANVAGALCYVLGPITGLVFLLSERRSRFVRFHAVQSTVTFGALWLASIFGAFIPFVGWIVVGLAGPVTFGLWLFLMWKAWEGERFKLPLAGDVAEEHGGLGR